MPNKFSRRKLNKTKIQFTHIPNPCIPFVLLVFVLVQTWRFKCTANRHFAFGLYIRRHAALWIIYQENCIRRDVTIRQTHTINTNVRTNKRNVLATHKIEWIAAPSSTFFILIYITWNNKHCLGRYTGFIVYMRV